MTEEMKLIQRYKTEDLIQRRTDIHDVMSTEAGRRLLFRIVELSGFYKRTMDGKSCQFDCGRRNLALDILADVKDGAPGAFRMAEEEAEALDRARAPLLQAARDKDMKSGSRDFFHKLTEQTNQ